MSKHSSIALTADQRTTLTPLIRAGSAPARTHTRARILLWLDRHHAEPFTDEAIAKALRCHRNTVGNVRRRFVTAGLQAALYHKLLPPRAPKKLTGEVEAHLMALACNAPPEGQQHRTRALLASPGALGSPPRADRPTADGPDMAGVSPGLSAVPPIVG